jgi:hypothetical protein
MFDEFVHDAVSQRARRRRSIDRTDEVPQSVFERGERR